MNKSVYYFIYCGFIFWTSFLYAQNKTYIGDTVNVLYYRNFPETEIDSVVHIKKGKRHSAWIIYFEKQENSIAYRSYINGDSCLSYDYWRNGKLKKKDIYIKKDSLYIWVFEELYCENGQFLGNLFPNIGQKHHYIDYYCNGNKKEEYDADIDGFQDGKKYQWYENGKIKSITSSITIFNGYNRTYEKNGDWKYYNENGKLDSTQVYKNNKLVKTMVVFK